MTAAFALQLYAPFVGLIALAFWMGVLSQRVSQLEKGHDGVTQLGNDMAVVKTDVGHIAKSVDELKGDLKKVTDGPASRRKPSE